jgi:hypothetical protein
LTENVAIPKCSSPKLLALDSLTPSDGRSDITDRKFVVAEGARLFYLFSMSNLPLLLGNKQRICDFYVGVSNLGAN